MKQTSDRHHRLSTAVEQRVEDKGFLGALGRSRITIHPVRRIEQVAIGCIRALMVRRRGGGWRLLRRGRGTIEAALSPATGERQRSCCQKK